MIVIKVELHSAITNKVTLLGTAIIHNLATGTKERGDYECLVGHKSQDGDLKQIMYKPNRKSRVYDYPRLSYNVWRLVIRGLLGAFPEEKSK